MKNSLGTLGIQESAGEKKDLKNKHKKSIGENESFSSDIIGKGSFLFKKSIQTILPHEILNQKPCARDGHSLNILDQTKLVIFGGDRHKMSFNDIYVIDLECLTNQSS